ncbi:DUF3016 domain-containing protein [Pelomonas sp. SE-A7]|uniref:DUF3016 domain-containing protein n=1 Tax=Pelomonas sp. SE-A7 TaxID=3054953 RepID=UPI00259C8D58|nr:DUF3016 domain-containing protein [Pelomonas sp. SE-A7]MDM4765461.1 DUF3016 domain-containing protein [Pelomonas sp. SE-A7]
MNRIFKPLLMAALLVSAGAQAAVTVRFVQPEKFVDLGWFTGDRDETLKGIQSHLQTQAAKYLSGSQDLAIEVSDVNLAGEEEPWGRRMDHIRVMRQITIPTMDLSYKLTEGGRVLKEGKAHVVDMNYMDRSNRYSTGDQLRFEKRMLDEWLKEEFGGGKKP